MPNSGPSANLLLGLWDDAAEGANGVVTGFGAKNLLSNPSFRV